MVYDRVLTVRTDAAGHAVARARLAYVPPRAVAATLLVTASSRCGRGTREGGNARKSDRVALRLTVRPPRNGACLTPVVDVTRADGRPIEGGATLTSGDRVVVGVDGAEGTPVSVSLRLTVKVRVVVRGGHRSGTRVETRTVYQPEAVSMRTGRLDGHADAVVPLYFVPARAEIVGLAVGVSTGCGAAGAAASVTVRPACVTPLVSLSVGRTGRPAVSGTILSTGSTIAVRVLAAQGARVRLVATLKRADRRAPSTLYDGVVTGDRLSGIVARTLTVVAAVSGRVDGTLTVTATVPCGTGTRRGGASIAVRLVPVSRR